MLISTTNSFANISAKGYPILALFVLIDRTTCQLTKKSVIASSRTHCFVFLLFFLNALIFLKLTPKIEFKFSLTYVRTLVKEDKTIQDCIYQVWVAGFAFV